MRASIATGWGEIWIGTVAGQRLKAPCPQHHEPSFHLSLCNCYLEREKPRMMALMTCCLAFRGSLTWLPRQCTDTSLSFGAVLQGRTAHGEKALPGCLGKDRKFPILPHYAVTLNILFNCFPKGNRMQKEKKKAKGKPASPSWKCWQQPGHMVEAGCRH